MSVKVRRSRGILLRHLVSRDSLHLERLLSVISALVFLSCGPP